MAKVKNAEQAQEVIANLLMEFGSETATARLQNEAQFAKQTAEEQAWRTAGNLLRSYCLNKPGGRVR